MQIYLDFEKYDVKSAKHNNEGSTDDSKRN